jgi:hypothetical protein
MTDATRGQVEFDGTPTVLYRLFAADGSLLYVGITTHLQERLAAHADCQPWWPHVARKTAEWCANRGAAAAAEKLAIVTESPRHNIQLSLDAAPDARAGSQHKLPQTAFRLPEGLLAWLREQAATEERTQTAIVRAALEEYRRRAARNTGVA